MPTCFRHHRYYPCPCLDIDGCFFWKMPTVDHSLHPSRTNTVALSCIKEGSCRSFDSFVVCRRWWREGSRALDHKASLQSIRETQRYEFIECTADVGASPPCSNINCGMFRESTHVNLDLSKFVRFSFLYNRHVAAVITMSLLSTHFHHVDGGRHLCMEKTYVYKRRWKCEKITG